MSDPKAMFTFSIPHQHTDADCRHPARKTLTAFMGGQAPFLFLEFDGFNLIRGLSLDLQQVLLPLLTANTRSAIDQESMNLIRWRC